MISFIKLASSLVNFFITSSLSSLLTVGSLLVSASPYTAISALVLNLNFTESFLSRLLTYENIQGRMIVIMQRLHKNDLCGYLKEVARNEWEEVNLEAINKEKRYMRLETLDMRDKRVKLYLKKDIH